jgi:homoserine dehydrogenase
VLVAAERNAEKELDPVFESIPVVRDAAQVVAREDVDVVVELTRGLDTVDAVREALERRKFVVTPNKPLVREHGADLERLAFERHVRIAYRDSIAAGWPLLHAVERPLAQGRIVAIQAVLSTSCNVVLERVLEGISFDAAVEEVVRRELTEVDPELDLSGWDTAQKLSILVTRAMRRRHALDETAIVGLRGLPEELVRAAPAMGLRVKLVALARLENGSPRATVRPMAVPADGHLGSARGLNHVVVLQSATEGEIVQIGPGFGTLPVATAVLNDLIGLTDPEHSWTGRYPVESEPMASPAFDTHFCLNVGRPALSLEATACSVPMLTS